MPVRFLDNTSSDGSPKIGTRVRFLDEKEDVGSSASRLQDAANKKIGTRIRFLDNEIDGSPVSKDILINSPDYNDITDEQIESGQTMDGSLQAQELDNRPPAIETISNLITGGDRVTEETQSASTIGELPELNQMTLEGLKSAFVTMTGDDEESAMALKANFPDIQIRKDEKGNIFVKSAIDGNEYIVNKPGLDIRDTLRFGLMAAMFSPVGKVPGALAKNVGMMGVKEGALGALTKAGTAGLTQAGIEAGQTRAGGDFDIKQVIGAGIGETIAPGLSKIARGVKSSRMAPSALEKGVESAENLGIVPMTSDVMPPKTFFGKTAQAITERIPVIGTGPIRAQQRDAQIDAARSVIREFGGYDPRNISDEVMQDVLTKRSKDLQKYTDLKTDVINKLSDKGVVNVENTVTTIDNEISKLKGLNTKAVEPVIKQFEDFKNAFQDQNLVNVEQLRRQLGEQFKSPDLVSVRDAGEKAVSKIYKALNDDMGEFIKANGDNRDFTKWKLGNKRLSDMSTDLKNSTLKSVLKRGDATPEQIRRLLFSNKPSDIKNLYKSLTPDGKGKAKVAIFQEIGQKVGDETLTPANFLKQIKNFEKSTDVFLSKQDKQVLEGMVKALNLTKQASVAGVKPPTGAELTAFATPTILSYFLGGTGEGLAGTVGLAGAARIYESKGFRNLMLRLSRAPKGKETEILNQLTPLLQSLRNESLKKESKNDN